MLRRSVLTLFVLAVVQSWADDGGFFDEHYYRHEVTVGYGGMVMLRSGATKSLVNDLSHDLNAYLPSCWSWSDDEFWPEEKSKGYFGVNGGTSWSVDYYYHPSRRIAVGGSFGMGVSDAKLAIMHLDSVATPIYQQPPYTMDTKYRYDYRYRYEEGQVNAHSYFVMPSVKWFWTNLPWSSFYMKATGGLHFQHLSVDAYGESAEIVKGYNKNAVNWSWAVVPFGWEIGHKAARGFMELGFGSSIVYARLGLTWRFKAFH